jgi:hypothetical protein
MGRVSGQVIEDGTNTAVVGAVFVVLDTGHSMLSDPSPASVTDRDGHYQFGNLPAGRLAVTRCCSTRSVIEASQFK